MKAKLAAIREHIDNCRECSMEGMISDDCEEGKALLGPWHLRMRGSIRSARLAAHSVAASKGLA